MKDYNAAIYLRLSKEDRETNNSIDIQREITTKYAKEHNFNVVEEYVDNGYSGILSSRPALNKMMIDIVRKKVNMVIVKDMSRLTRDKNLTSYYTDIFFPDNDVRVISVTEYIDTGERYEIADVVALRGIVNQSYIEDTSRKIKAVKRNFKEQGKFIEDSVAYGYKKDSNDKHKIVIDREIEPIIKEIYQLFISGIGPTEIAKTLNERKVKTASQYLNLKKTAKYWTKNMINRILTNPIYTGSIVLNKYETSLRLKKRMVTSKKDFKLIEGTHEAIISIEDYNLVQQMKGGKTKKDFSSYIYLLKGLVYCKNCGRKMTYKNSNPIRVSARGIVSGNENDKGYFVCTEHYRHKEVCNEWIKIMEKDLNKIVLDAISNRIKKLQLDKWKEDIRKEQEKQTPEMIEYKKAKNELARQELNFKSLYSKKVEGIVTETEFLEQYESYKQTIKELKQKIDRLELQKSKKKSLNNVDKLISEFENCKQMDEHFIKKIVKKIEVGKNNEIDISLFV